MTDVFPQGVLDALRGAPDTVAFEHGSRTVTRGEVLETARRLACGLRAAGLAGGAVALATGVTPEAFAVQLAAHALGCRVVGVRPGYPPRQLAVLLGAGVDAVIVDASMLSRDLRLAAGRVPLLALGPCPAAPGGPPPPDLLAAPDDGTPLVATARPADIARLTSTSGSTGMPKSCAQSYAALTDHWAWRPARWTPDVADLAGRLDRYLLFGTFASPVVLDWLGLCLLGGGTAVIPDELRQPLFPWAIERYRVTGTIMTPPRMSQLLDALRDGAADVSSLRMMMVAGSPVSPARLAEAADRLGPVVYQGYGQTEAGLISLLSADDIHAGRGLDSVGRPLVEVAVRDGEIWVRGPNQMTGYWNDPAETAAVLRDGWLRTRDLGHLDGDGYLHLAGRSRDIVIVNAVVCYAGPIERVLADHPDVAEAYVVGAPDERTGEAIHAFVVTPPGRTPDPAALVARVRAELGESSVPRTVTAIDSVPVAASGKPDKRALLGLLADPVG
ncbi:MAG: class I adenylate-forming enzyme family protein [Mycobacteriales bacterium]